MSRKSERHYKIRGSMTLRKWKKAHQSGSERQPYKPPKWVTYCPICPRSIIDPEHDGRVYRPDRKRGVALTCAKGHKYETA